MEEKQIGDHILKLIESAKAGNAEAFGELYGFFKQDLFAIAYYYTGRTSDAEDAVQDAALDAFKQIGSIRESSSFKQWIIAILVAKCKKKRKDYVKENKNVPIDEFYIRNDIVKQQWDETMVDDCISINLALNRLKPEERMIVVLSTVLGYSSQEIGSAMKKSSGTIRSKQSRALSKMKEYMQG